MPSTGSKVQQAIGAYVNFTESSDTVGSAAFGNTGDDDRTQGSVEDCRKLIAQGIYLVQVCYLRFLVVSQISRLTCPRPVQRRRRLHLQL